MGGGTDRYRRQRRIQEATYAIAQAVTSSEGLDDLFARIHRIVAGLMEARNLYVALLDDATGNLTFPYFRDEIDAEPPAGPVPVGRGLTGYVLRKGEPLLASPEVFDALVARGEVEPIGAASIDWLGVPLRAGERTIGVLAVQSYAGNLRYGEEDQALLGFVSSQVALAIERRRAEERACARARGGTARSSRRSPTSSSSSAGTGATSRSTPRGRRRSPHRARPSCGRPRCQRSLPPAAAEVWMEAIGRCLDGGGMQVIQYALDVPAGRRVFEGRIVAHDADSVLSLVRDVTEARRAGAGAPRSGARAQAPDRQHARRHRRDGPRGRHPVRDAFVRGGDGLVAGGAAGATPPSTSSTPRTSNACARSSAARRAGPGTPRPPTASGRRTAAGSGPTPSPRSCGPRTASRPGSSSRAGT